MSRGNDLLMNGELWAVIVFDTYDPDGNLTADDLPRHISYKIRFGLSLRVFRFLNLI